MTVDERVQALMPLGLTHRQAAFLVTVALHSAYCLRRHYTAFTGLQYGKNVRAFLDGLVARRLARRTVYRADRGYLYHVHAKALYRAIDQPDNRHRRTTSPARIAQRLMVLDHVLREPEAEWFATEGDKVALFTERFRIPLADLPQRTYRPSAGSAGTTRYFVHKLPIAVAGDPPSVHLVFLATEPGERATVAFLRDHARLLRCLPKWTFVAVCPAPVDTRPVCRVVFDRHIRSAEPLMPTVDPAALRWYCRTRQAVERDDVAALSSADLDRFRAARRRFAAPAFESLYANWLTQGDAVCAESLTVGGESGSARGRFQLRPLPFTYGQCGTFAGVS